MAGRNGRVWGCVEPCRKHTPDMRILGRERNRQKRKFYIGRVCILQCSIMLVFTVFGDAQVLDGLAAPQPLDLWRNKTCTATARAPSPSGS